jgi:hypothetical protein
MPFDSKWKGGSHAKSSGIASMMKAVGAIGLTTLNRAATLPTDPARGTDMSIKNEFMLAGTTDGNENLFPSMSKFVS